MNNIGIIIFSSSALHALRSSFSVSCYVFLTLKENGILMTHRSRAGKRVRAKKNRMQSNLDYPDLDYPDYSIIRTFFSGPNFFMNIN